MFGVINPINYYLLSEFIASNWNHITRIYALSHCSGSRPKFPSLNAPGRAIEMATLAMKRQSQRHLASSFPIITHLDINRFYGSIYTHSIPWAVLGKHQAKWLHSTGALSRDWSDTLDRLVRNCNQSQTVGIPIGPDTSRIISELILSRIDSELCSSGNGIRTTQVYHDIDDYQIGTFDVGAAETVQSQFVRTISRYELRLNDFKTSVEQGLEFAPSNFQRNFDILAEKRGKIFVEHFFELLYAVSTAHKNSNVIGYSLKRFARSLASNPERGLVREYLQRLLFATPHQARWILPLLLGIYRQIGVNAEIKRIISWGIQTSSRRNDVGSLLWFLYGAIFLRTQIQKSVCELCIDMSNELVDLVLIHGRTEGLFNFNISGLRRRYQTSDFKSPAWLPLYEVERRGWDRASTFTKIGRAQDHMRLFEHLRDNDVEFYVVDRDWYRVEAFEGWHLTQDHFVGRVEDVEYEQEFFGYFDEWENYD